jgi:hypothetical protein
VVAVVREARNDDDSAAFRGYPVTGRTQVQPDPAQDTPSRSDEFSTGSDPAPDVTPVSIAGHVTGSCRGCQRGEQDHYDFAARRGDPGMVGVTASRMIQGGIA